jgi:hypothetical protein
MSALPFNRHDIRIPTVIRRAMEGETADVTDRCRYLVLFAGFCARVTSGEIFWR